MFHGCRVQLIILSNSESILGQNVIIYGTKPSGPAVRKTVIFFTVNDKGLAGRYSKIFKCVAKWIVVIFKGDRKASETMDTTLQHMKDAMVLKSTDMNDSR